jgi:hypothetical protein
LKGIQLWFARNSGALFALFLFVAMFAIYVVPALASMLVLIGLRLVAS